MHGNPSKVDDGMHLRLVADAHACDRAERQRDIRGASASTPPACSLGLFLELGGVILTLCVKESIEPLESTRDPQRRRQPFDLVDRDAARFSHLLGAVHTELRRQILIACVDDFRQMRSRMSSSPPPTRSRSTITTRRPEDAR